LDDLMALKVWHINKWNVDNVYWDPEGETIDGPTTDGHVEVVEKAEYDRLRGALEKIASQGPEAHLGVEWKHWKTIAREALDASTPSS
jgi:hypothetical protein